MSEQFEQKKVIREQARRLVYPGPFRAQIVPVQLASLKKGHVLVKAVFGGISRGTESLVFQGKVPQSEWANMRCLHQDGEFEFPVSYGYSLVGSVVETANASGRLRVGDRVFVMHPHQNEIVVEEHYCNVLPAGLPDERAVLSANAETALNAIWDAGLTRGDTVAVFGAGVLGLLIAVIAAKRIDSQIVVIDRLDDRRETVERLGLRFLGPSDEIEYRENFDCIFNTTASGEALQNAINLANFEGRIMEVSWYGNKPVELCLGGRFHSQRLSIISTQVGSVSKQMRPDVSPADRMQLAMAELLDARFDYLLEPPIAFKKLPEAIAGILGENKNALCQLISYTES